MKKESAEVCGPATAALRAASLLRGGVPAARVWKILGEEEGAPAELQAIAEQLRQGTDTAVALARVPGEDGAKWRVLAAAWALAAQSGAPVALMLERMAGALTSLDRLGERRSVLLAGPRATIRLVAALPVVALLMGWALGFDPTAVMLSPMGAAIAVIGGALLAVGVYWARLLIHRLAAADWVAGLECELCWISLSGGAAQHVALCRVATSVDRYRVNWVKFASLRDDGSVQAVLRSAAANGTPAGPMLLAEANAARSLALAELERQAERLAVRVLVPIGVCVLPSFIVLGVLPVLFAVIGSLGPIA